MKVRVWRFRIDKTVACEIDMDEDGGLSCKRLFLGGATVAAAKAAAAPAERVKILLQVQVST